MSMSIREKEMSETQFTLIPIDLLAYSGKNPRTEMRGLEEFAENIKKYGVLEPIIVRPKEEKFEVVVGERRVRASIMAELKEIPAIIKAITDRQADLLCLIENIQRDDLTNFEKADGIIAHSLEYETTYKQVAEEIGVDYNTVKKWLYVSRRLSEEVKRWTQENLLQDTHTRTLAKYNHQVQNRLAEQIIRHKLTTFETEKFCKFYDENPLADLGELVQKAKSVDVGRVAIEKLPERVRKEVKQAMEKKPERKPPTKEVKKKISETRKDTEKRKKEAKAEKKLKPLPPLLPEEKERLEKYRRHLIRERKEEGKSVQARVEAEERVPKPDVGHNVIIGDAREVLKSFPSSSVDLVITSPPYFALKDYPDNPLGVNTQSIDGYLKDLRVTFEECLRVLKDGRFFCIVVGQFTSEEISYFIPVYIAELLEDIGFRYRREHIWVKPLGIQGIWNRGTTQFLKEPYPRNAMINIHHEHILIFQKGDKPDIFYGRDPLTEEEVKNYCWSVWEMPVSEVKEHPAPFPDEIPERLIKMYSYKGEVVLDPFLGSGTCTKVAKNLNRFSIGIELLPEYLYLIKTRVEDFNIIRYDKGEKVDLSILKELST
jgi:ParB/RepB/Spo0J family partition protein